MHAHHPRRARAHVLRPLVLLLLHVRRRVVPKGDSVRHRAALRRVRVRVVVPGDRIRVVGPRRVHVRVRGLAALRQSSGVRPADGLAVARDARGRAPVPADRAGALLLLLLLRLGGDDLGRVERRVVEGELVARGGDRGHVLAHGPGVRVVRRVEALLLVLLVLEGEPGARLEPRRDGARRRGLLRGSSGKSRPLRLGGVVVRRRRVHVRARFGGRAEDLGLLRAVGVLGGGRGGVVVLLRLLLVLRSLRGSDGGHGRVDLARSRDEPLLVSLDVMHLPPHLDLAHLDARDALHPGEVP